MLLAFSSNEIVQQQQKSVKKSKIPQNKKLEHGSTTLLWLQLKTNF